jgi:uncharacterized FlaG/YvyC family protein
MVQPKRSSMDIKGVFKNAIPFVGKSEEAKARQKTDADNDREGNGQATNGDEQKRRALTPEEIQEAVTYLEALPGVKDNGLNIRLEQNDGITVVYIEDRDGKVVRRIPESELGLLTGSRQKKTGHLLNKAM